MQGRICLVGSRLCIDHGTDSSPTRESGGSRAKTQLPWNRDACGSVRKMVRCLADE